MSVAGTYADALYEAAQEAGRVEAVTADLERFARACEESPELARVLGDPDVDARAKKAVVAALTEGAQPLVRNFLQVLLDRGRIEELGDIAGAYERRASESEGRLAIEAVTAVPLPDDLRERLVERLGRETGREVDLTESVDPEIVGGLVLRVEGAILDGSVRHRLDALRLRLGAAPVDAAVA